MRLAGGSGRQPADQIARWRRTKTRNKEFQLMCLAVPGQVQEIYEAYGVRMGRVDFGGVVKEVCLACVPDIATGDYTLVHVGVAISKLDEQSALETLKLFQEMGVLEDELTADASVEDGAVGNAQPSSGAAKPRRAEPR